MRTYLPTLVRIVRTICIYTARYDDRLRQIIPPEAIPAYEALRLACAAFDAAIPPRDLAN